jgi:ferric-dicitrate binding protein FerR (iron transport regulator)
MKHVEELMIQELMKEVAAAQRSDLRRAALLPKVQRALASRERDRDETRRLPAWRWVTLAAGTAAVATAIVVAAPWRASTLSYAISHSGQPARAGQAGPAGDVLAPPPGQVQAAVFSDGSRVEVAGESRARIDAIDAHGATVVLDEGQVEASIVHRSRTRWQVRAGDYRIRVTGTRFSAAWSRRESVLTVRLHEGSVEVTGPGVSGPAARVTAGQVLRVSSRGATLASAPALNARDEGERWEPSAAFNRADEPILDGAAPAPVETSPVVRQGNAKRQVALPPAAAPAGRGTSDWRALAARARYQDALSAAVAADFEGQCERLQAHDLVLLGDVARLGGDLGRADQAYRAARRRFPNMDRSAFALGVMAFEGRQDYKGAAAWFTRYLREHPRGPLATEASGRLLEAWHRAGEEERARQAAQAYLREHPAGPHAALARRLAGP